MEIVIVNLTGSEDGKPPRRTRASKPKSRTGCITCKIRRVKCGEEKPHCLRCTSTGRNCDGYAASEIRPKCDNSSSSRSSCSARSTPSPPPDRQVVKHVATFGSPEERRSLEFFYHRTAPQLAGFFSQSFWREVVLQIGTSEPTIRNAIVTVSAFHEKSQQVDEPWTNTLTDKEAMFAYRSYNKAIGSLLKWVQKNPDSIQVPLIACIVFTCTEFLRGDVDAAISHIENGIKILSSWRTKRLNGARTVAESARDLVEEQLTPMFAALNIVTSLFGRPSMELYTAASEVVKAPNPIEFSSRDEARAALFDLLNEGLHFIQSVGEARYTLEITLDHMAEQIRLTGLLEKWHKSFERLATRQWETWSTNERGAADLLRASHLTMKIWLAASLVPDESAWDEYKSDHEAVVALMERFVRDMLTAGGQTRNDFSFEMCIIPPLHFVCWKCRFPVIRRKALALLYAWPRREGLFDSRRSWSVFERIMHVEEAALGLPPGVEPGPDQLPPEYARIHQMDVCADVPTAEGAAVNLLSKPNGVTGAWHIQRVYIHIGRVIINRSISTYPWHDFKADDPQIPHDNICAKVHKTLERSDSEPPSHLPPATSVSCERTLLRGTFLANPHEIVRLGGSPWENEKPRLPNPQAVQGIFGIDEKGVLPENHAQYDGVPQAF